ncbi:hypothetical protein AHAS_Ahas14G0211300 [Arachis hypogaea]
MYLLLFRLHKMTIARPCRKDSTWITMEERDLLERCGSIKFATKMASASTSPFSSLQHALDVASDIWCNKINVHSWLIALNAHTNICEKSPFSHAFYISAPSSAIDSSIEAAVKDFDLNKKPFWKEDLDPVAREKARRFCDIWYPGEYYV